MKDTLSKCLDVEIELLFVADYTAVVEAMKYGHADIARLGAFSYVLATEEAEVEALGMFVRKSGKPAYHSLLVGRADRMPIDLRDATFAFVDVASTSGYLAPKTYLKAQGIEPKKEFLAGSHPASIQAVKNGTIDVGAVADGRLAVALEEGVIAEGEFEILWKSPPIPSALIAVRKALDGKLKQRITTCFCEMPRETIEACATGEIGFEPCAESAFDFIREMQKALDEME